MPAKPHKWVFKMLGRAGQSGFLYDFDVCQGAQNPDREKSEVGVTGEVVLKMTSTLPVGKKITRSLQTTTLHQFPWCNT